MGAMEHVATVKVKDTNTPLREGPHGESTATELEFLEKYNLPKYKVAAPKTEFQDAEGRDPTLEVRGIVDHKGKGKKRQYRVQWVG